MAATKTITETGEKYNSLPTRGFIAGLKHFSYKDSKVLIRKIKKDCGWSQPTSWRKRHGVTAITKLESEKVREIFEPYNIDPFTGTKNQN